MRRPLAIALAVLAFLVVAFGLARFLTQENRERDRIDALLHAEARGDVGAVLSMLAACDPACGRKVRGFLPRVSGPGAVKIARLDSGTSYSVGTAEGWTRVVWVRGPNGRPLVQCVRVRRRGAPFAERRITLLRITAPLADNEQSC